MSQQKKQEVLAELGRCSQVVAGELGVLTDWEGVANSLGRRSRCNQYKQLIGANVATPLAQLVAATKSKSADKFQVTPASEHSNLIVANEAALAIHQQMDVNQMSKSVFRAALSRMYQNSKDALADARLIEADTVAT